MPKERKLTMNELMGDIKTARDFLTKQQEVMNAQPQGKAAYPDVTDVMKGKA